VPDPFPDRAGCRDKINASRRKFPPVPHILCGAESLILSRSILNEGKIRRAKDGQVVGARGQSGEGGLRTAEELTALE
jgi:hypothetical protein